MTCPCCSAPLTEQQIKTIWGAYCNSKRTTPPKAGPGRGKKTQDARLNRQTCCNCGDPLDAHEVEICEDCDSASNS